MKSFFSTMLMIISLFSSGFFVIGFILWKIANVKYFSNLFDFPEGQTFYLIFLSFLILCNLPYLKGIVQSIVRDKISEQTIIELIPNIKEKIKEDKNFIKELIDHYNKDKQRPNIDEELINK